MKKIMLTWIGIIIILASISYAQDAPVLPSFYYGKAIVNGHDAPLNSVIRAKIGSKDAGQLRVIAAGQYGSKDNDNKLGVTGIRDDQGSEIQYYIVLEGMQPIKADESGIFQSGAVFELDLNFNGAEIPAPKEITGGSSGGSGGSSGGSSGSSGGNSGSSGGPATAGSMTRALFTRDMTSGIQSDLELEAEKVPFTRLQLITRTNITEARFRVEVLEDPDVPKLDGTYAYVEVEAPLVKEQDIQTAIIRFRVDNIWLLDYDASKVTLYRYGENGWEALNTVDGGSDDTHHYYRAQTPGFGIFSIASEEAFILPSNTASLTGVKAVPQVVPVAEPKETEQKSIGSKITGMVVDQENGKTNPWGLAVVIAVIVAISYLAYHFVMKR
jgi:PGF-pre-PGF domain-containing protein